MDQFLNIYGFLAVLLRAATLIFQSLIIGGTLFSYAVLGRWHEEENRPDSASSCEWLLRIAGFGLAATQALYLSCESFVLMKTVGLSFAEIAGADFFVAGIVFIVAALLIATIPYQSRRTIWWLGLLSLMVLMSSVATSHAFSRLQSRAGVVAFTALHLAAAGCWIGGLPYLLISVRGMPDGGAKQKVLSRYSQIALLSVGVLVASGIGTALRYFDSAGALYGTAYGIMLISKFTLLGMMLILGAMNRSIVNRAEGAVIRQRLQHFVAVEIGIGIAAVLTATSMTSQPPAIDLPTGRVDAKTIVARFTPEWPRLRTPPLSALSPATRPWEKEAAANNPVSLVPGGHIHLPNSPADIAWSEYNHNWAGVMLTVIGLLATVSRTGRLSFTKHWPLAFLLMAAFIFLRADPENWPLGPNGFLESFDRADVLQHRLAVLLIIAFAFFEWRVQLGRTKSAFAPLVFPFVCVAGGMLLMTHNHTLDNIGEELLVEMSHLAIALLAILAGWSRWLQLKLPTREGVVASWIWPICFVLMGGILLTYREA
jgi:copper resistance protein D